MKNLIAFLSLWISLALHAQQPQWLNPKPFGGQMYDIEFFDTTRGLMVGAFGALALTTDEGQSWQLTGPVTTSHLYDIEMCNPQTAIIMADTFLLRTDDGGQNFTPVGSLDSGWYYASISMVNQNLGYAACKNSFYYGITQSKFGVTHNGGISWQWSLFNDSISIRITHIEFLDSLIGVGAQAVFDYPKIYRTTDGGQSWNVVHQLGEYSDISRISRDRINGALYILNDDYEPGDGDYGTILKSIDSGVIWHGIFYQDGLGAWDDIKTIDDSIVLAAGFSKYFTKDAIYSDSIAKNIFISSDAGESWTMASKPLNTTINGCTAVGLRTSTNAYVWTGNNLNNQQLFETHNLNYFSPLEGSFQAFICDMDFKNNCWYLLSSESDENINAAVLKSVDQGITWDTLPLVLPHYQGSGFIEFIDENVGLVAGNSMDTHVYSTTDGGNTWNDILVSESSWPLSFCTFGYGSSYLLTWNRYPLYKNSLLFSGNLGSSWNELNIPSDTINFMQFISPDTGFLFGGGKTTINGGYYSTHDSGLTWQFVNLGVECLKKGCMLSSADGYVSAGGNRDRLYYVKNGVVGIAFEADTLHSIVDFDFSDAHHGYIVTLFRPKGLGDQWSWLHYTANGGLTWETYGPYEEQIGVITFYDANGFAYGAYGQLLQLGNGYPVGQPSIATAAVASAAWPNPASDVLQISLPPFARNGAELTISNMAGEVVFRKQVSGTSASIGIRQFPVGLYLYSVANDANRITGKVVIE